MMPIEPDHYAVLELEPGSPMEEVKSQYRRLAKRCHPDLHGNDAGSQEEFRRINAAYAFLSDAPRKAAYDACLQAARKRAMPPKPAPSRPFPASPSATGYHAPMTDTGYHERATTDLRMTRSAWLGATAGVVVILLFIGLSLDVSDPAPSAATEAAPLTLNRAPGGMLGGESEPGSDAGLEATISDPAGSLGTPAVGPAQSRPPRLAPAFPPLPASFRGEKSSPGEIVPLFRPASVEPPSAEVKAAEALKQQIVRRSRAALLRTDRLIARGSAVRASRLDMADGPRRRLRDQLSADLTDLSVTRARLQPALAGLSRPARGEDLGQATEPLLTDLRHLEDARQSVQDDLQALSSPAFTFVLHPKPSAAPVAPLPAVVSAPATATQRPRTASTTAMETPKPRAAETAKPNAPASSGQPFILWGQ